MILRSRVATPSASNDELPAPRRSNGRSKIFTQSGNMASPARSFKKEALRYRADPEIAATRCPTSPPATSGDVIQLEEHRRTKAPVRPSYVRVTMPQLAAAGLVLMMASGAGAWMLRPALGDTAPATFASPSAIQMASRGDGPVSPYAEEIAVLEKALSQLGDVLAPSTVRIIQKNLIIIDQAIEESTEALRNDPNDDFLRDYLDRVLRRKVEYLRETAAIVGAEI